MQNIIYPGKTAHAWLEIERSCKASHMFLASGLLQHYDSNAVKHPQNLNEVPLALQSVDTYSDNGLTKDGMAAAASPWPRAKQPLIFHKQCMLMSITLIINWYLRRRGETIQKAHQHHLLLVFPLHC